ncbi:hypothetical protein ACLGL1_01975 [Peptococcus simiae]|uniref:hypothetical protein n=1 Tax=Peptococcus simiae TaxID=1643805 RepID=UPI0039803746
MQAQTRKTSKFSNLWLKEGYWAVWIGLGTILTAHRDYVKMETVALDFKDAIAALQAHGFTEDDYLLQAEYTRKWGMI